MWAASSLWLCCLSGAVFASARADKKIPAFPSRYMAQGTISLPYAEIVEPYTAYVDGDNDRSRIDTYHGLASVFRLGNEGAHGTKLKVVYETTEQFLNKRTCFHLNGSSSAPLHHHSLLPNNPERFEFTETKQCSFGSAEVCEVYGYKVQHGDKIDYYTFTMMVRDDGASVPVRFHFLGADLVFSSHFDEYIFTYDKFYAVTLGFPADTFVPPIEECVAFPAAPGSAMQHRCTAFDRLTAAPLPEDSIDVAFRSFKAKHSKAYANAREHFERSCVYRASHHFVESSNRRNLGYRSELNHLADLFPAEKRRLRGLLPSTGTSYPADTLWFEAANPAQTIPESRDWRIYGAVTSVKDQGICGSCWAFGVTGVIEGAYFIKHGRRTMLSEQSLIDCTWGVKNLGCEGGLEVPAYQWIMNHGGIATSESYGPYLMQDGKCNYANATIGTTISAYVRVRPHNETDLLLALMEQPVAVNIDAGHESFSYYASGVYYEPKCHNKKSGLDHAVLAVGFGTLNGDDYWLVKNSWSTHWGNNGYALMSRKNNNCGVATDAQFVRL
ncbi:digestive cysteine proteinase 1-like [Sycon ciliatum]|uniref:digestive cysteine proteinase 1-like n=1 Tax=Sycon ciliatum TaxID=27933 RepID=UPI0031F603F7